MKIQAQSFVILKFKSKFLGLGLCRKPNLNSFDPDIPLFFKVQLAYGAKTFLIRRKKRHRTDTYFSDLHIVGITQCGVNISAMDRGPMLNK